MRFADILTTASAVANYLGEPGVTAAHLLAAIAILRGEKSLDDLGRPVSPLIQRGATSGVVHPPVQVLVQQWFARLGNDVDAELDTAALAEFTAELAALAPGDTAL